jgi:hypothetical protein
VVAGTTLALETKLSSDSAANALVFVNGELATDATITNSTVSFATAKAGKCVVMSFGPLRGFAIEKQTSTREAVHILQCASIGKETTITVNRAFAASSVVSIEDTLGKFSGKTFKLKQLSASNGLFVYAVIDATSLTPITYAVSGVICEVFKTQGQALMFCDGKFSSEVGKYDTFISTKTEGSEFVQLLTDRAAPEEVKYKLLVDKSSQQHAYRVSQNSETYLIEPITSATTVIKVKDVSKLVSTFTKKVVLVGDTVELNVNRNEVSHISVYNHSTESWVSEAGFNTKTVKLAPSVVFTTGVSVGDVLSIHVHVGSVVCINGEQIRFTRLSFEDNTLSGLFRGANHSAVMDSDAGTRVVAFNSAVKFDVSALSAIWNSSRYEYTNTDDRKIGDPLNVSLNKYALFLRS